ncbi:peptidoglycan DD-metalloendopeptidase family protein [Polynucleobacter sp. AM-26B4]|uniref:peptidoglycan DD-metalloendopeptidase family protein n=1 Tax=Polynucleobacter sp. AM-26B4 TaxID=2689103 RepID=UPI001C0E2979|nr:peptidoglycan DD-metalloendopeptidase family protein [Polynucleobacter sp. AM-26B4]MBU3584689.1 peptidoglycan DD-metalloendopeptidase family protein [Polynucleobacter sp. AM-26B4]
MNFPRLLIVSLAISTVVFQSGCATRSTPAPVVDRSGGKGASLEPVQAGFYRIKRGDTLLRIALDHGQSHRDIAEWNNIADMNQIEVDQVIRVAPSAKAMTSKVEVKQEKPSAAKDVVKPSDKMKDEKLAKNEAKADKSNNEPAADAGIKLSWPSKGNVIDRFDEGKNKGIGISGKSGDPIQAAADGKVVYAGNSLRGYGNLLIVKHDNTYLTAYAHNKTLLVKEGDTVKKAQKIAEMGNTDADQVKLHFEVRKHGKPVDPMSYLP